MILMDEMIPLRLYSSKLRAYIPFNALSKKKNALVTLLTDSLDDSVEIINMPYIHNPNYFISYYLNRNVNYYLSKNGKITVEDDEEESEEDEAIKEAVLRVTNRKTPQYDTDGSQFDLKTISDQFSKKKFNTWYDYFSVPKDKRIYPVIYGFEDRKSMVKAIGDKAITDHGTVITDSYNTVDEIFVINRSGYFTIERANGPYDMYCDSAIITYIVSTGYRNASWYLANQIGCALSGQADYLYKKNNYRTSDKLSAAIMIARLEREYGKKEILKLARTGEYNTLASLGAKDFIARVKPIFQKPNKESALVESDGSHNDALRVYKSMSTTDRKFISPDDAYQQSGGKIVCYRHIEREGFITIKGFVECFKDIDDSASIVIGVHPKYRGEGIATRMMEQLLKEFPKENPDINELIWRADAKNNKSKKLAEKFGFKLIRKSNIQWVYRYEFKSSHKYDDIPDDILCEEDLVRYVRKTFTVDTSYVGKSARVTPIKDIIHIKKVKEVDIAYFCFRAIQKMGLSCAFMLAAEHKDVNLPNFGFGDLHAAVLYYYTPENLIVLDPFGTIKAGFGTARDIDAVYTYLESLHDQYKWGDRDTFPQATPYCTFSEDVKDNALWYKDVYRIETLASQVGLKDYTLLEFENRLNPPTKIVNGLPRNLQSFEQIEINDDVINHYKNRMPGLCHLGMTNNCHGYLFVDQKTGNPVCYYNTQRKVDKDGIYGGEIVWLQGIEVAEEYRNCGIGKQLLQMAIARDHVTNLAVNKNNEVAYRLYTNLGFKQYAINGSMINMQLPTPTKEVYIESSNAIMQLENQVYVFSEDLSQTSYDTRLKRYLFKQRLRNSSMQIAIYKQIKERCPKIRKTFTSPAMYNGLNLFIDLSYYNRLFLENNETIKDIAIKFYWEFLNRLLDFSKDPVLSKYGKNTIFIPVWKDAWNVQPGTGLMDWKVNLNPISMIFRMLKKAPEELRSKWGNKDIIFIGKTGYFKVDFSKFAFKDLTRFRVRLERLWRNEHIEDTEEDGYDHNMNDNNGDPDSSAAIAAKVIDKIEDSTGVEINNVSGIIPPTTDVKTDGNIGVQNLRIRNTKINSIQSTCSIAVLAPTDANVVDFLSKSSNIIDLSKSNAMRTFYSK